MPDRPTGTVTFLFTDIEGSTTRWEHHRSAMQAALTRHDALLRQAIDDHGGYVFKTVGDAFCAAFASPLAALEAALAAQRALASEDWGTVGPIRVRMALHTGLAQQRDDDYFGPPLNRIARLLSAGHGMQVLLSGVTQELVRDQLPVDAALRDLGAHRLKDLIRPEHIFQLMAPDLPVDFPPLHTLDNRPNNLPLQLTPFIGRERELDAVRERLLEAGTRLLTLTGPGGTGKTRLALQVAAACDDFPDGVWFVDLTPLSDPGLVIPAIARTLGVPEQAGTPLLVTLSAFLREKHLLLLLDNFEHLLGAALVVADLLRAAPRLTCLVTSRAPLHLRGEHEYLVPPMEVPAAGESVSIERLAHYEALQLFIERAQGVKADFMVTWVDAPAVAKICARLDGLPLAIELAAARVKLLPLEALLQRLGNRLAVLTGGARDLPARQQTLRGTIDWSYRLLAPAEQALFVRLATFVGSWAIDAVAPVCTVDGDLPFDVLDGLQSLVDNNLVRQAQDRDAEGRFFMLETIREFALERLVEAGEEELIRRQQAHFYVALVEGLEPHLEGGPQQGASFQRLAAELDNLRAAFQWSLERGAVDLGLRLAAATRRHWVIRGPLSEGRQWLDAALRQSDPAMTVETRVLVTPVVRAKALEAAGNLAVNQGDPGAAAAFFEAALEVYTEQGDKRRIAALLVELGCLPGNAGTLARRQELVEQGLLLFHELGDAGNVVWARGVLSDLAWDQGDRERARALRTENLVSARHLGDKWAIAQALYILAGVAPDQDDLAQATACLEESIALYREVGEQEDQAWALCELADVVRRQRAHRRATTLYQESLAIFRDLGHQDAIGQVLYKLGWAALDEAEYQHARSHFEQALVHYRALENTVGSVYSLAGVATVAGAQGQPARAARLFGAAEALLETHSGEAQLLTDADRQHGVQASRAQLEEPAWKAAWTEGRALTLEQAIAYAMGESPGTGESTNSSLQRVPATTAPSLPAGLTEREIEVLRLVAAGLTDKAAAERLIISPRTVHAHLQAIYSKLGVNTRTAAVRFAVDHHLV